MYMYTTSFITTPYLPSKDVTTIQDKAVKVAQITVKHLASVSATRITGNMEDSVVNWNTQGKM